MKRLFLSLFVLVTLFASSIDAQEWHTANQVTITWDAVTELSNGVVIPEADIIEYKIYLANTVTNPDKTNPTAIGITEDTFYVITLVDEGQYFVGLQTLRKILANPDASNGITESCIGWTDDPAIACDGNTFGIRYFLPPMVPTGAKVAN